MAGKNSTELIFSQQSFDKLLTVLDNVERKLNSVQKTTEGLKKSSTSVTFKFAGLDSLDTFLTNINRGKVNQFLDLVEGFQKLVGVGAKTASFGTFVKDLNSITANNLKPIVETLKALAGAVTDKEAQQLSNIGKALRGFAIAGEKDATEPIIKFIAGIAIALKDLAFLSGEQIDTAAKNLSRFGNGLKNMVKTMQGIDNSLGKNNTALRIGTFFAELSVALKLVVKLQEYLGDGKAIRELSLTIERLGLGVAGLTKNLKDINVSSTAKLIAFLASMAVAIRIVTKISGDAKKTQAVASLFTGLAALLKVAFTGFEIKGAFANAKIFIEIQARINSIINIVKSIKNVNFKDAEGISKVVTAVGSLIESISKIGSGEVGTGGLNEASITTFKNFIAALKDLNKLKVSDSIGKSLEGIGNIFANFDKVDAVKAQASNFGGGLSNAVALGFVKGTLIVDIGKTIFKIFAELNPITLTAKFVTGMVSVFVGLSSKINEIIASITSKINDVGSNLTSFGEALNSTFGVGSILNSSGFQVAAAFDDLANKSKVIGNLSEDSLKQVLAVADAVGQKYPVSANQALAAIINLQKAGINAVPDITAVISPIADLAALSDSGSIDAASNTVIQVISSFKQLSDGVTSSYENAATAADILSRGADNSTASVESLSAGLANVGPTAASFGLNLEDTVAVLSLFEDRGIKGAEAGTQLKSVLTNLTRPTDSVRKELKHLGIQLTDSKGNFRDMNDIINQFNHAFNDTTKVTTYASKVTGANKKELDLATKAYAAAQRGIFQYQNGLTTGALDQKKANEKIAEYQKVLNNASNTITKLTGNQKDAAKITTEITRTQQQNFESIQKIFGTYGQAGAAILTSLGDDAIKNFTDQMGRLPTAAEKAQLSMQSFNGQVEQLQGSAETLLKNFFLPMIQDIFKPFVIGLLGITNAFLSLDPEILAIISTGTAFLAIFASIVGTISIAAGFFVSFGGAVLGVVTSMASLGAAVVAGIGGFVIGLVSFIAVAAPVIAIFGALGAGFRLLVKIFSEDLGGASFAVRILGDRIGLMIEYIQSAAGSIGEFLGLIFGNGNSDAGLEQAGSAIASFVNGISSKVLDIATLFNQLGKAFKSFVDFFNNGIDPSKSGLEAIGKLANNPFISFLLDKGKLDHSAVGVNLLFRSIKEGVVAASNSFKTIASGIGDLFAGFSDPSKLEEGKKKISDGISQLASTALKALQTLLGVDFSASIAAFDAGDLSKGITTLITKAIDGVKNLILNNRDAIKTILTDIFNFVFNPLAGAIGILDFLGLKDIAKVLRDVQKALTDVFGGIVDTILNLVAGQDLKTALLNGFGAGIAPVIKFAEKLASVIGNVIGFVQDLLANLFPVTEAGAAPNLLDIVTGVFDLLTNALTFLDTSVLTPLRQLTRGIDFTGLTDFIGNLFGSFVDFFNTLFSGDISGALGKLKGIGSAIFDAIKNLVAGIFNIDFTKSAGDVVSRIAAGIASLISSAVGLVSGLINGSGLVGIGSGIVQSVIDAITNFIGDNPAQKFANLASSIVAGIGTAIVNAITTLGTSLGVDPTTVAANLTTGFQSIIDGIQKFFAGDQGIFTSFDTIFNKIKDAIKSVLDLFTGGDASPEQAGKAVFNVADALQKVFDFLSKLAGLALTGIGDSLSGIADFFSRIADLPGDKLLLAGVGLAAIVATIVVLANYATIMATIASGLTTIGFGLAIFVGAVAALEIGKNLGLLADVFDRLLSLDISGAAGKITEFFLKIAAGVTFDILGLFGINTINGDTPATVNEKIRGVADFVKQKLDELGVTLKGIADGAAPVIDFLKNTLTGALKVLGFIASLVTIPIQLVQGAVKAFTDMDEKKQRSLVEFLFAVGVALTLMNATAILTTIASGFLGLAASFLTVGGAALAALAPFVAIVAAVVLIKAAADNIDKLFNVFFDIFALLDDIAHLQFAQFFADVGKLIGDIIDFVGNTLTDAFFTVAGFFGFDKVLGQTKDDIKTTISQIVYLVKTAYERAAVLTAKFFRDTFNDLSNRISIAAADLRLAAEDAQARVRTVGQDPANDPFFKAQAVFEPKSFNLTKLSAALADSTIDQTALRDFAIKNAGLIKDALETQLTTGDNSADGLFKVQTGIQFAIASNNISQVVDDVFSLKGDEGKKAQETFMKAVSYALSTGSLNAQEASGIIRNIFDEVSLGTLDPTTAQQLLATLDLTGAQLTPEQKASLQKQIDDGIKAAALAAKEKAEGNPVPIDGTKIVTVTDGSKSDGEGMRLGVPVTIDPKIVPPSDDKKKTFFDDVKKSLDDQAAANQPTAITTNVPVAPVFTGVTNQEDITKFKGQIDTLNTGLDTANTKFTEFAGAVNDNVTNMQTLADAVAQDSSDMQANFAATLLSFTTFRDAMVNGYNDIAGSIARVTLAMSLMMITTTIIIPTITNNLATLKTVFTEMASVASTELLKTISSVKTLDDKIKALIEDINTAIAKAGSLGGIDVSGKREKGGPVWKGLFEVGEHEKPELLFQNGKIFLISPTGGQIEPMSPVGDTSGVNSSFGLQQPVSKPNQNSITSASVTNFTVQEGDINLNITGGNVTPETVNSIRTVIRQELDNKNKSISDRLRTAGRS